jgi:anaerobic ribonucleoside-triphosphate reductase activating protein
LVKLRVYHVVEATEAEGPGRRACVWVQGCSLHCAQCFNAHLWTFAGGKEVDADALGHYIARLPDIEGVTFLGGEPFDQAEGATAVARAVRDGGRSVMTFTGYRYEELLASRLPGARELLAATDLLVDGRYVAALPDYRRPWVGSANQRFRFLTARYEALADELEAIHDRVEVRLRRDGTAWINGQAPTAVLARLRRELGLRPAPREPLL